MTMFIVCTALGVAFVVGCVGYSIGYAKGFKNGGYYVLDGVKKRRLNR